MSRWAFSACDNDEDDDSVAMWVGDDDGSVAMWVGGLSVLANCHQGVLYAPTLKIRINDADAEDDDFAGDDYENFLLTEKSNWFPQKC